MLINVRGIMGNKIVTERGNELEDVDDIVYDEKEHKVLGFLLKPDGLKKNKIVLFKDVMKVEGGKIQVKDEQAVKEPQDVLKKSKGGGSGKIARMWVMDEKGTKVGWVYDVYFQNTTGKIKRLEVIPAQGNKSPILIKTDKIKSIGEVIVIKPEETNKKDGAGGLKKITKKISEKVFGK